MSTADTLETNEPQGTPEEAHSHEGHDHDHDDHAPITGQPAVRASLDALIAQLPLARRITGHWCDPRLRATEAWRAHEDINAVMLATSLVPAGYLDFVLEDVEPARSTARSRR